MHNLLFSALLPTRVAPDASSYTVFTLPRFEVIPPAPRKPSDSSLTGGGRVRGRVVELPVRASADAAHMTMKEKIVGPPLIGMLCFVQVDLFAHSLWSDYICTCSLIVNVPFVDFDLVDSLSKPRSGLNVLQTLLADGVDISFQVRQQHTLFLLSLCMPLSII